MIVSLREFKTQIDRYLELAEQEEVIITKDGRNIARLMSPHKNKLAILESLFGILPPTVSVEEAREERLAKHEINL